MDSGDNSRSQSGDGKVRWFRYITASANPESALPFGWISRKQGDSLNRSHSASVPTAWLPNMYNVKFNRLAHLIKRVRWQTHRTIDGYYSTGLPRFPSNLLGLIAGIHRLSHVFCSRSTHKSSIAGHRPIPADLHSSANGLFIPAGLKLYSPTYSPSPAPRI